MPIEADSATFTRALHDTLQLARRYRLSSYDASYLELALRAALPPATLDEDLRRAALKAGVKNFKASRPVPSPLETLHPLQQFLRSTPAGSIFIRFWSSRTGERPAVKQHLVGIRTLFASANACSAPRRCANEASAASLSVK
jgi:hypothetical protein